MKRAIATPKNEPTRYEDIPPDQANELQQEWDQFEQTRGMREKEATLDEMLELNTELKVLLLKALAGSSSEKTNAITKLQTKLDVYKSNA